MTTTNRRFADALARLKRHLAAESEGVNTPETPQSPTFKTYKTPSPGGFEGFEGSSVQACEEEIVWRVGVFRRQIPPRGPIPFLVAHAVTYADDAPRGCGHCGDPLPDGHHFCCAACQRAKEIALGELRDAVPESEAAA